MDIVCRKRNCAYNDRLKCERKHLSIGKNAKCTDYQKDSTKPIKNISKDMFDTPPDIAPYSHCKNVEIKCKAKDCILNDNGLCKANGIIVNSCNECPYCITFLKK